MNKFNAITLLVLFFILLSIAVTFASFSLTPKIKMSRAGSLALEQATVSFQAREQNFDKAYVMLQNIQEREGHIDNALKHHFDLDTFESYLQGYFKKLHVKSIESEQVQGYQYDTLNIVALVTSPVEYYHFIDALNNFEWVVEVDHTQEFKQTKNGIQILFSVKVYTALTQ